MFNLNDVRYFLAVAEAGSLSRAARQLGATQPTVGRRINAMEKALGARLFERTLSGFEITSAGRDVLATAQSIEDSAWNIVSRVAGEDARLQGRVRLATSEGLGTSWLPGKLPQFRARYPGIDLDLLIGTSFFNLLDREADIALRVGRPGSDELVGRCLSQVSFGLYASVGYLHHHGKPKNLSALAAHAVVDTTGVLANSAQSRLLHTKVKGLKIRMLSNSLVTQLAAVRAGAGIAALPNYVNVDDPKLLRVLRKEFDLRLDLWLLTHQDLRSTARIRAVREFIQEQIQQDQELLLDEY